MKKIAIGTVKNYIKKTFDNATFTKTYTIDDSGFDVEFRTSLTIPEKSAFIRRVVNGCFDDLQNYRPEYYTPIFNTTFIQMCTNLPVITLKGATADDGSALVDIDETNQLYKALNIDMVYEPSKSLVLDMSGLCWEALDWKRQSIEASRYKATADALESLSQASKAAKDLFDTLTAKVNEIDTGGMMQYAKILADATDGLEDGNIVNGLISTYAQK